MPDAVQKEVDALLLQLLSEQPQSVAQRAAKQGKHAHSKHTTKHITRTDAVQTRGCYAPAAAWSLFDSGEHALSEIQEAVGGGRGEAAAASSAANWSRGALHANEKPIQLMFMEVC
jgi:hypothetical protein